VERKVEVFKLSHERAAKVSEANAVDRQNLVTSSGAWTGVAYTAAGVPSAWHHHDDNDSFGYVISGRLLLEFGAGGKESAEVGPGEAFHVPKNLIHRETTLGTEPGVIFVVRVGRGEPFVNVEKPDPL
jgi:uncharacterized RmlC-like cupin family protein